MMNYQYHYDKLINRAPKTKPKTGYFERHRIVPGCLGGKYTKDNIAFLTPEEHYVAHQLLVKIYPGNKSLLWAVKVMSWDKYGQRVNNKEFGWLKRKFVQYLKTDNPMYRPEVILKKSGANHHLHTNIEYMKRHTEMMISDNPMFNKEIANKFRGDNSPIKRPKVREKLRKVSLARKKIECIHCGKIGQYNVMKRWHFDKCKSISNENF